MNPDRIAINGAGVLRTLPTVVPMYNCGHLVLGNLLGISLASYWP
jgi:hypothetical protein